MQEIDFSNLPERLPPSGLDPVLWPATVRLEEIHNRLVDIADHLTHGSWDHEHVKVQARLMDERLKLTEEALKLVGPALQEATNSMIDALGPSPKDRK